MYQVATHSAPAMYFLPANAFRQCKSKPETHFTQHILGYTSLYLAAALFGGNLISDKTVTVTQDSNSKIHKCACRSATFSTFCALQRNVTL